MNILDKIINYINGAQVQSAAYTGPLPTATVKRGSKGENVKRVQRFLNCDINAKLDDDGKCGSKTVAAIKKFQKKYKLKVDGIFGTQCRRKMSTLIKPTPKPTPTPTPKPTPAPTTTGASKIIANAKNFAYPSGTSSKTYSYKNGKPKSTYPPALKKYMGKKARVSQTDCGYFVNTCVRASGLGKFTALGASGKKPFPKLVGSLYIASKGKKITLSILKPGDIIRYHKTNGGQHVVIYLGNGYIAHASRNNAFPRIQKKSPWNNSNVKVSSLQIVRAK